MTNQGPGGGLDELIDSVLGGPAGLSPAPDFQPVFSPVPLELGASISVEDVRELTEAEVAQVPERHDGPGHGQLAPTVTELRAKHHEVARLMAAGLNISEICELVGTTPPTINRLRRSPAFADLLHSYMAARDRAAVDLGARIKGVAAVALEKIQEKLEQPASQIPFDVLQKTAISLLDRAGHSPVQKQATVNVGLTAADIRAIKFERQASVAVIPAGLLPVAEAAPQREEGGGALVSAESVPVSAPRSEAAPDHEDPDGPVDTGPAGKAPLSRSDLLDRAARGESLLDDILGGDS